MDYEIDYEQKYRKYKKLYLNLKSQRMAGGDNDIFSEVSDVESKKKDILEKYNKTINDLKSLVVCKKDITDIKNINEIKKRLKEEYKLVSDKVLATIADINIFEEEGQPTSDIDYKTKIMEYRNKICNHVKNVIIPQLEKERDLVKEFLNTKIELTKENIQDFVNFVKDKDIGGKPLKEVIDEYVLYLKKKEEELQKQLKLSEKLENFFVIKKETEEFGRSLNNHICTSACTQKKTLFGLGEEYICNTVPYKTWTGTYDWDYCKPAESVGQPK